jgi:hypothetical protein
MTNGQDKGSGLEPRSSLETDEKKERHKLSFKVLSEKEYNALKTQK